MFNLQPKDIIAILTIIAGVVRGMLGLFSELDAIVALILGYYFSHRKPEPPPPTV